MKTLPFADLEKKWLVQSIINAAPLAAACVAKHLRELPDAATIVFYGCGEIARQLVIGQAEALQRHTITFATTEVGGEYEFHGFHKKAIADFTEHPPDAIILLSHHFERAMLANLTFMERDRILTLPELIRQAAGPELYQQASDAMHQSQAGEVAAIRELCDSGKPVVCFTSVNLSHNFLKIMRTLSQNGYGVVVILNNASINNTLDVQSFREQGFFQHLYITQFSYALELHHILNSCPISLLHAVASMAENVSLAYALDKVSCPVVVEYLDFKQIVFGDDTLAMDQLGLTKEELVAEKTAQQAVYCRANGVIIKDSPEIIDHLAKKYGYRPTWISFMSYISTEMASSPNKVEKFSQQDGRIHIVYAGCLHNNPQWHPTPIFRSTLTAIRQITDQGIHFSIYNAMDNTGAGFEEYLELAKTNELFEYHFAVPYHELPAILSRYDYGWFCFDFSNALESPFFHRTTMGSKIFTYLEAGLPVLVAPVQAYMASVVEDLGVGIPLPFADISRLQTILNSTRWEGIRENIERARRDMTMDKHLPRLLAFYQIISQAPVLSGKG